MPGSSTTIQGASRNRAAVRYSRPTSATSTRKTISRQPRVRPWTRELVMMVMASSSSCRLGPQELGQCRLAGLPADRARLARPVGAQETQRLGDVAAHVQGVDLHVPDDAVGIDQEGAA